jgi:5-methylcytosine-specific restriction endonuclease McrA
MPGKIVKWFYDKTSRVLDPGREQRVEDQAAAMEKELARLRQQFVLDAALNLFAVDPLDEQEVLRRAYLRFVRRAWDDGQLTDREATAIRWVAKALRLPEQEAQDLQRGHALERFRSLLTDAFSDGVLSDAEYEAMRTLAAGLQSTVSELVRSYMSAEGEGLLRSLFLDATNRGAPQRGAWDQVVRTVERLGFSREEFGKIVAAQSQQLVEHVLADAKADGVLTVAEEQQVRWLMDELRVNSEFRAYVSGQLESLRRLTEVREGKLPSVEARGIMLPAGEIAHFFGPATHYIIKELKSGRKTERHEGALTVTDARCLFVAPGCTKELNHRKVVQILPMKGGFEVRASGRGGGIYGCGDRTAWVLAVYEAAVARAKQTLVTKQEGLPSRHIPRDIRQRVWQKYGGRCAECNRTEYLEFDHIVPVARGGSNGEMNVQLLCRRCNSSKSDLI